MDNGKGIPEDLLEKIFDPYFSTKERSTQKGMGLAASNTMRVSSDSSSSSSSRSSL